MGLVFTFIVGALGINYYVIGARYHGEVTRDLQNSGKHGDYTVHELNENDINNPRKLIPGNSPFILFKLSKDKRVTVVDTPYYLNVGNKGGISIPVGGGSHTEMENIGICSGWNKDTVFGGGRTLQTFDEQEYDQKLYLNSQQAVSDFCYDVNMPLTQYQLKPTIRVDYSATNTVHIFSGRGSYYVGANRQKLIVSASDIIAKQTYPGYISVGVAGAIAICIGMMVVSSERQNQHHYR
jgi:hypothetical protein